MQATKLFKMPNWHLELRTMQDKKFPPQKVFYDGQIYDAFEQMKKFVRMAKTELIIFLIIDKTTLIHVGASLNHLGKKCFAFSSLDKSNIPDILAKL